MLSKPERLKPVCFTEISGKLNPFGVTEEKSEEDRRGMHLPGQLQLHQGSPLAALENCLRNSVS